MKSPVPVRVAYTLGFLSGVIYTLALLAGGSIFWPLCALGTLLEVPRLIHLWSRE